MFNYKKISAVLTSALMIGMTAGVATAASYPAPFVVGSTANVGIVYGSSSLDQVPAINIETSLASKLPSGTSSGTTTSGGDSVLLAKSSDNLNMADALTDVFTGTVDEDDLGTLLKDGTYIANDNDEFAYEQKITISEINLTHFRDSDYESKMGLSERTPIVGMYLSSGTFVMNYTLDFTTDAETDIVSDDADDIEGSDMPLFGKTYYVSNLDNRTNADDFFGDLTLLDSADKAILNEGETVSVTVAGKTYNVGESFIGTSTVKFDVDGEITSTLAAGETYKLKDGAFIGVREINTQDYQGGIKTVEFSIGSGKLVISSGKDIKLNDVAVKGVKAWVYEGTGSSGTEKIDKIVIEWKTDNEEFMTPGAELLMPGFKAIKFTMGELVRPVEEKIIISKDDDKSIKLVVPIKDGTVTIPILHADTNGAFDLIGKSATERLATGTDVINFFEKLDGADYHDYFVASYNVTSEAESYLLRASMEEETNGARNQTDIDKNVAGAWVEVCSNKYAGETCDIGSVSLTIDDVNYTSGKNRSVTISSGNGNTNFNSIHTAGGLRIYLPYILPDLGAIDTARTPGAINVSNTSGAIVGGNLFESASRFNTTMPGHGNDTFYLFMDGEDRDDAIGLGTQFNLTIDDTSALNLQVTQVNGAGSGGPSGLEVGDSTAVYEAYIVDDCSPRILHYTKPDEDWAEVYYPTGNSETYGEVYLAETSVVVSSKGTTGGTALGEVIYKDTEVSSISAKNLIVVGGSCINSVAAKLIGSAMCTTAWETATGVGAGKYLIQSFDNPYASGSEIALLVAGYEAADTANAQKALINTANSIDTGVGKKYTGTTDSDVALVA